MTEYFIFANSFAAPFFSDDSSAFVAAETPQAALEKFAANYKHPSGIYAAVAYQDANAFHKGAEPLARWLCNHEIARAELTKNLHGFTFLGHGPGDFEINQKRHRIDDPKGGRIIA